MPRILPLECDLHLVFLASLQRSPLPGMLSRGFHRLENVGIDQEGSSVMNKFRPILQDARKGAVVVDIPAPIVGRKAPDGRY